MTRYRFFLKNKVRPNFSLYVVVGPNTSQDPAQRVVADSVVVVMNNEGSIVGVEKFFEDPIRMLFQIDDYFRNDSPGQIGQALADHSGNNHEVEALD